MTISDVTFSIAFLAGMASFLSPCVFALVPAYVGYLSGRSAGIAREGRSSTLYTLSHGLAFVLGFSIVFVSLGALAAALGGILFELEGILIKVGGVVVVIFGLHMIGVFRIPFLEYDLRPQTTPDRNRGYISSALMGVFFSAGWSPCVGPILGLVLTMAVRGSNVLLGAQLLIAYSAGLAIPFLLAATQIGWVTTILRRYGKLMRYTEIVMGAVMVIIGGLLFSGRFEAFLAPLSGRAFFGFGEELLVGRYLLIGSLIAVVVGLIPAAIARNKGRNFIEWWFIGLLFPIAIPAALLLKPLEEAEIEPTG